MRTLSFFQVDPVTLSFEELKKMVNSTAGKHLPIISELMETDDGLLFIREYGSIQIGVYTNGFYFCCCGDNTAVFAVDRCRTICFADSSGVMVRLYEKDFRNGPCLIPLVIFATSVMGCTEELSNWMTDHASFLEEEFHIARYTA